MNEITQDLIDETITKELTALPEIKANPDANEDNALGFTFNGDAFKVVLFGDNKNLQINPVFELNDNLINTEAFGIISNAVKSASEKVETILNYDIRSNELLCANETYSIEENKGEFIIVIKHKDYVKYVHPNLEFRVNPNDDFVIGETKAEFYALIEQYKIIHNIK